jgi:hydrogenase maturation protease
MPDLDPTARSAAQRRHVLVVGLGNEHRGDDAAGILVARILRPRLADAGAVLELDAEGTELLDAWEGRELAVVIDAVAPGGRPGAVRRIEVGSTPLPKGLGRTSSHGISLAEVVGFGEALHQSPKRLVIYGIEAVSFEPGAPLSAEVSAALEPVARQVEEEVRRFAADPTVTPSEGGGVDA